MNKHIKEIDDYLKKKAEELIREKKTKEVIEALDYLASLKPKKDFWHPN